jgi:hypothetical protein
MAVVRSTARVALAGVRLFNGGAALVAPRMFAQRMGRESDADGAAVHALRMFGIRTVLIALDLLSRDPAVRRHALRRSHRRLLSAPGHSISPTGIAISRLPQSAYSS